jgi:DNA modification methylase
MTELLNKIYAGDAQKVLVSLPDNSIDCCVTSPPYFGLRDYGVNGQIGLENTPDAYVSRLMDVFTEVYRVLKPEGTFWLNIGDSYAGSGKSSGHDNSTNRVNYACNVYTAAYKGGHIKAKDLIGIP